MLKKTVRSIINKLGYNLVKKLDGQLPADFEKATVDTYNMVKEYTMTSAERIASLCNAVRYLVKNNIAGDIVECGVWRGGSTMAAIDTLIKVGDTAREVYLYDTFEGMSEPSDLDKASSSGTSAAELLKNYPDYKCVSTLEEVQHNVGNLKYPAKLIHYVKGKVEETIPGTIPAKIALLRLDTDWFESTAHELQHLYPLLVPGGVIIIDDYGHWEGARKAVDEYIARNKLPLLLNRIDYTGRIGVKY
jgi:O-methyltransferase